MNYKRTQSWFRLVRRFRFPNRKYKDRLFQRVFRDKKYLLELYNAINGTSYDNPDDLEITTLEDVIFMSMKNDKSFMISSTMNLYEHQSTVNPKLPMPQYIVFYNGKDKLPDDETLLLSDAFECDPMAEGMKLSIIVWSTVC